MSNLKASIFRFTIRDVLWLTVVVAGCSPPSATQVSLSVPNGFRGALVIQERPGLASESGSTGKIHLKATNSGEVFVSDMTEFSRWFEMESRFENGTVIPAGESLDSGDRQVAIWALHTDEQGSLWHYIGTNEEAKTAAVRELQPGEQVQSGSDSPVVVPD